MQIGKPKFWSKKNSIVLPYIFFPLSLLVRIFNAIKLKYLRKEKFEIPVICVGNIYLGGTGKTPLCIEIFKIAKSLGANPAFIKKSYDKFFDENKLLENVGRVFQSKRRSWAIKELINSKANLAILDDGFQDFGIKSNISIVCFNEKQWIGNGFVIPSGPLRENLRSLNRSDYIFINGKQNSKIEEVIYEFSPKTKIFYTQYKLINLENIKNKKVLAFAGIGNPNNFFDLLKKNNVEVVEKVHFPDHHNFTKKDIMELNSKADNLNAYLITTEKDYVRLNDEDKKNIGCIKIELLINNKDEFINDLKKII